MIDKAGQKLIADRNGIRSGLPDGTYHVLPGGVPRLIKSVRGGHPLGDSLVYSPGEIKAEADTTNAIITQLYQDAVASPKIPQATRNAFYAFCNEWVAFYQNHTGWFDRLWFSNLEKITDYRKRAATWRAKLGKVGLKSNSPEDAVRDPGITSNTIPWKWIVLGAIGVTGAVMVVHLARTALLGAAELGEAEMMAMSIADAAKAKRAAKRLVTIT